MKFLPVITIVAAAFFIYTADYYHSDSSAADALVSDSRVTVEQPDGNLGVHSGFVAWLNR